MSRAFGLTLTTSYEIRVTLEHNGQFRTASLALFQRTFSASKPGLIARLKNALSVSNLFARLLVFGPLGA